MKTVAFWGLLFLSAVALVWAADREVVEKEVAKLQADLTNLQADLQAGGGELDLPATLGERIQSVREEVIYLKVRMRKHRDAGGEGVGVPLDEKAKLGVGAGLGTILGAVIGGKKGAVIGAVLGGSGAILATEGKEVELPAGTILKVRLDRELNFPIT